MPDYESMYYALAAQVADAVDMLIKAQRIGEESALRDDSCILEFVPRAYLPEEEPDQPK